MHDQSYEAMDKEDLQLELNLEAACDEDTPINCVMALDLPNETSLISNHELYIEEADPVGLGNRC